MKLRYSPTSPYVRKVSITAIEAGLDGKIERVTTDPWAAETDLGQNNPIGKVPCLITDDGEAIYDSPVICEYLDSLNMGRKLFPADGKARLRALKLSAIGDGALDAGVLRLIEERRRPAELKWDWWTQRQHETVLRCLTAADHMADEMSTDQISIGEITVGAAIGWLDFRFADLGWRTDRPALADWYDKIVDRPSFAATAPKA